MEVQTRKGLYGFEFREPDLRRRDDKKTYNAKSLWQRSHEIVNLAARGFKNIEIAEILNITPNTVSNTLNSDLGEKKLSKIRYSRDEETKKVSEKIRVLTDKAINTYHDIFDDEGENASLEMKRKSAETVLLELSGLRAPTRVHKLSANYQLTPEELESFKARGVKAAKDAGMVIDITPEVEELTE